MEVKSDRDQRQRYRRRLTLNVGRGYRRRGMDGRPVAQHVIPTVLLVMIR